MKSEISDSTKKIVLGELRRLESKWPDTDAWHISAIGKSLDLFTSEEVSDVLKELVADGVVWEHDGEAYSCVC